MNGQPFSHIRNKDSITPYTWDWVAVLRMTQHVPRGARPCDIDGILERRGHFLVFEGKSREGRTSKGQQILLESLVRLPQFTVVEFHGRPPASVAYGTLKRHSGTLSFCGRPQLSPLVDRWGACASRDREFDVTIDGRVIRQ